MSLFHVLPMAGSLPPSWPLSLCFHMALLPIWIQVSPPREDTRHFGWWFILPLPLCRLLTSNGLILRHCGLGLNLWSLSRPYSVYKKIISEEVTSVSLLGHLWGRHIFEFSWWKLSRYWVLRLKLVSRYWGNTVLWHKDSSLRNHSRSGLAFGNWG